MHFVLFFVCSLWPFVRFQDWFSVELFAMGSCQLKLQKIRLYTFTLFFLFFSLFKDQNIILENIDKMIKEGSNKQSTHILELLKD